MLLTPNLGAGDENRFLVEISRFLSPSPHILLSCIITTHSPKEEGKTLVRMQRINDIKRPCNLETFYIKPLF